MKLICISLLALLIAPKAFGQDEIRQTTEIKDITVFLSGAEVHRTAKVSIASGSNQIIFEDLSPYISPNSVQVKAKSAGVTIVSVNQQPNYLIDKSNDKKLKIVTDSLEDLVFAQSIRLAHQRVHEEEKGLLLANKSIGGANKGVETDELMDMADFFRTRLLEIETKLLDIRMQLDKLNKSIARLTQQKNQLTKGAIKSTTEIVVNASSKAKMTVDFELTYIVAQAGWVPRYDIRSFDISQPIELTYKADVYNQTGFDWKNVNIILSTGNPSIDNTQPVLYPWYLQYYQDYQKKTTSSYGGAKGRASAAPVAEGSFKMDTRSEDLEQTSASIADFTQMIQSSVNTEFKIGIPYTINSDGKPYLVEIQKYEMPVDYAYLGVPKNDKDAFLLARVSGWGNYNLLPGDANVYFEGSFIGSSYLETSSTKDTLDVSLGRDKGIVIERNKIDELCKNTSIGGNHKTSRGYEIVVRNNKAKAITIVVYDQIPLSSYKEVEVTADDLGKAEYNEKTGELKWRVNLGPNETKKLNFKYTVKYPKEYNLNNL